jgi:hypothetical protein
VAERLGMQPLPKEGEQLLFEIQKTAWQQDVDYWLWFLEEEG